LDKIKIYEFYWPLCNVDKVLEYYRKIKNKKKIINNFYHKIINYYFDVNRRLVIQFTIAIKKQLKIYFYRFKMIETTRLKREKIL
jgi:hypothetical protein